MKQIYNFEQTPPPYLTEAMLRRKEEQKNRRIQIFLLVTIELLLQAVVILLGYSALEWYPKLSVFCLGYLLVSSIGVTVVTILYSRKGGFAL